MKDTPCITSGPESLPRESSAPPGPQAQSELRKRRPGVVRALRLLP